MNYIIKYLQIRILHPFTKIICKQEGKFYHDVFYGNCYTIYYTINGDVYKIKKT
jgi:hypothetical protein